MMEALIGVAHCTMSSLNFSLLPRSVNHTAQGNRSQMATTSQLHVRVGALRECIAKGLFVPELECIGSIGGVCKTYVFVCLLILN